LKFEVLPKRKVVPFEFINPLTKFGKPCNYESILFIFHSLDQLDLNWKILGIMEKG
jgi:hypothetical protein